LRFCVPLSLSTAPSTGLPFASTMRPLTTPFEAVGAKVELKVQAENWVTPVFSQLFTKSELHSFYRRSMILASAVESRESQEG